MFKVHTTRIIQLTSKNNLYQLIFTLIKIVSKIKKDHYFNNEIMSFRIFGKIYFANIDKKTL